MHQLSYSNDLFFKYTLSREDEGSVYARNTIIERVTGIRVKESTVLNPNLDPGIILDVHVKDEQNRHFNIEMQTTYKGLAEMMRFEFYGARALNNQLNSGKKYRDLKPVYQIIFIDEYAWNNRNLINQYQMRNEQGEKESYYPLILRTYIHMPAINDIVREKEIQRLNDFEQLVYLFENNGKNDILKSKERLVKVFMDKYEEMQKDDELWSTAMAIQMGEARYRYGLEDSFEEGKKEGEALLFHKLGDSKIMALGSSVNDYVMVRNVSCLFYDGKIYFKTDKNFRKTQQLYRNPQVALCTGGVQVEGIAVNKGLVVDEPGRRFEALYKKYLWQSYNAYSHEDTEILIEVTPRFVEIWDEDENRNAFQIFLDFDKKTVEIKPYD